MLSIIYFLSWLLYFFFASWIDLFIVVPYFIYYIARLTAFIEQIRVDNQILRLFFFSFY